ncbi:DUF262 domain-containing protein [Tolypothrix campylonemoides VB511288]|nr:DUF262 domain-containing protein [Tolypothrix campylonemoides VB511288]
MTELKNFNPKFPEKGIEIDEEEDIEQEKEDITAPFDPTQIRVDTRPMTIDLVLSRIKYDELDLAPDFQRRDGIWTDTAKSRLIESIFIRIPLPAFYLDATNEDKWLVIDGLQRLTALKQFVINKQFKLKDLEYLKEFEGKTYNELPRNFQRRILETVITVYLIEKGTPPEVKFNIFRRINTGGLPLSPQELRHALNQGKATKFLTKLAASPDFLMATGMTKRSKNRMEDHEFVLRFLAFSITSYTDYQAKLIDVFLNETMVKLNKMNDQELNYIEEIFLQSMRLAYDIFGQYAFRKISKSNLSRKYPINKALFEVWSVSLSKLSSQGIKKLLQRKQQLFDRIIDIMDRDDNFMVSISQSTSKISTVNYRFSTIEKLLQELLS